MFFNDDINNGFAECEAAGAEFFEIGKSVLGKSILCTHVGSDDGPQIIVQGALHAREWITTLLVFSQIKFCLQNKIEQGGIYFIPIMNPDGVDIAINGTNNIDDGRIKENLKAVLYGKDHRLFKANATFVDLNTNFDARWGKGKDNLKAPSTQNYIGPYPHSEPEVQVLAEFTKKINPIFTISLHSKGEEIYWWFYQKSEQKKIDKEIAKFVSSICGYKIKKLRGSAGGYKDWCIDKLGISSLTIEVGSDDLSHPLTANDLPAIKEQMESVPYFCLKNFVECDTMTSCKNLMKSKNKNICVWQLWKQCVQEQKKKCR